MPPLKSLSKVFDPPPAGSGSVTLVNMPSFAKVSNALIFLFSISPLVAEPKNGFMTPSPKVNAPSFVGKMLKGPPDVRG